MRQSTDQPASAKVNHHIFTKLSCCSSFTALALPRSAIVYAANRGLNTFDSTTRPNSIAADAARDHETLLDLTSSPLGIFYVSDFDEACRCRSKRQANISHSDCIEEMVM